MPQSPTIGQFLQRRDSRQCRLAVNLFAHELEQLDQLAEQISVSRSSVARALMLAAIHQHGDRAQEAA
jgi:hypothetical protein